MPLPGRCAWITPAVLAVAISAPAQDAPSAWREDLAFLAKEFPARHKNPFTVLSREEWSARVTALDGRIGTLDDLAAQGELATLLAAVGDSHSALVAPALAADPLPVVLYAWRDGVYIHRAPPEHKDAVGCRVTRVGGHDLDEAARRLGTLEAWDNPAMKKARLPARLVLPKMLRFLGLIQDGAAVPFTLESATGSVRELVVAPGRLGRDAVRVKPKMDLLTAQRRDWHFQVFLEAEGLLYVQYNRCATDEDHDLDAFGAALEERCAAGTVKTIVFDLQYNGGGNSALGDAMFRRLARHAPMKERKNVFCVIGRATFSSGILNANALKARYGAVLVGEPTGGSPNAFGEIRTFKLPRSGLEVVYSTKRFERGPPGATTIEPDHVVEPEFADYLAGRDLVHEKIRELAR